MKCQFICAFVVAALDDLWQKWKCFRAALRSTPQVDSIKQAARYGECQRCPMFFKPLGTCGSPFMKSPIEGFSGCDCHCWTKAGTAANCSAYDHFKGQTIIGWPLHLNSFPYEQPSSED